MAASWVRDLSSLAFRQAASVAAMSRSHRSWVNSRLAAWLSVVKCGEDGKALIIRGYETCGAPARTTLHLPFADQSFELAFAPHEIKTIRIDPATWRMEEVNLLEE